MWRGNTDYPRQQFLPSNLFLAMLVDAEGEEEEQEQGSSGHAAVAESVQPASGGSTHQRAFKLPAFWDHAPDMWFCRAEFRFEVAGITAERDKFAHVVDALSYEALKLVKDLMMAPPAVNPYSTLKDRILLATKLTPVQMAMKLMAAPDMGDRRPSHLLAALMEFCPPGEENTAFFRAAFILRLPPDIRAHLDGLETGDLKELAAKADRHWANRPEGVRPVAAVAGAAEDDATEGEEAVAALAGKQSSGNSGWRGSGRGRGNKTGGRGRGGGDSAGGRQSGWEKLSQLTICARHKRFGRNAHACGDPLNCQFEKLGN